MLCIKTIFNFSEIVSWVGDNQIPKIMHPAKQILNNVTAIIILCIQKSHMKDGKIISITCS